MNINSLHKNVRYLTNPQGEQTDVLIPLSLWETILAILESPHGAIKLRESWEEQMNPNPSSGGTPQGGKMFPLCELWEDLDF